jgi:hypothetical protein
MSEHIHAPFTESQVNNLIGWQESGLVHPYTCPDRGEPGHFERNGDKGTLVPTARGLLCPDCEYLQVWAHDFPAPDPKDFPWMLQQQQG